ncbi:MOSC domain-containing protein [Niveispirillum sp. KHB5.9]|uniref:MOSC domain-containing protein n=1 Tax=Niveispirillum sp. KHB5.9 TaxID=3400269 RepID=UPI003A8B82A3
MRILQVNVGRVAIRTNAKGQEEGTGIGKQSVTGPVVLGLSGLEGDESAYRSRDMGDTALHGFASESYAGLEAVLGRALPRPSFGENLLFEGYRDAEVRIGDLLSIGTALVMVNQPVPRCTWPGVLTGVNALGAQAMKAGTPGWYLNVVQSGVIAAGDGLELVERGDAGWTVAGLNALLLAKKPDPAMLADALAHPLLADRFKVELRA